MLDMAPPRATHSCKCPASQPCVSVVCRKFSSPHSSSRSGASTGVAAPGWLAAAPGTSRAAVHNKARRRAAMAAKCGRR